MRLTFILNIFQHPKKRLVQGAAFNQASENILQIKKGKIEYTMYVSPTKYAFHWFQMFFIICIDEKYALQIFNI